MDLETFPLRAESYGCEPVELRCRARSFERPARVARATRAAGLLLLGAVVSVPVPGWHLLAVPGFLVAAFVLGRARLVQERAIESVEGACPACRAEQRYAVPAAMRLPHTTACPGCRAFLKLGAVR